MFKKLRKDEKGFTLVELIVVIAILGALALLIVPRIIGNVDDAEKEKEIANARTLASEITVYNAQHDTDIKNNAAAGYVTETEYTTGTSLSLPSDITWPKATVVRITVDGKGNAAINIVTPTPTTGA